MKCKKEMGIKKPNVYTKKPNVYTRRKGKREPRGKMGDNGE